MRREMTPLPIVDKMYFIESSSLLSFLSSSFIHLHLALIFVVFSKQFLLNIIVLITKNRSLSLSSLLSKMSNV